MISAFWWKAEINTNKLGQSRNTPTQCKSQSPTTLSTMANSKDEKSIFEMTPLSQRKIDERIDPQLLYEKLKRSLIDDGHWENRLNDSKSIWKRIRNACIKDDIPFDVIDQVKVHYQKDFTNISLRVTLPPLSLSNEKTSPPIVENAPGALDTKEQVRPIAQIPAGTFAGLNNQINDSGADQNTRDKIDQPVKNSVEEEHFVKLEATTPTNPEKLKETIPPISEIPVANAHVPIGDTQVAPNPVSKLEVRGTQCGATIDSTKAKNRGKPCPNLAKEGSSYCGKHKNYKPKEVPQPSTNSGIQSTSPPPIPFSQPTGTLDQPISTEHSPFVDDTEALTDIFENVFKGTVLPGILEEAEGFDKFRKRQDSICQCNQVCQCAINKLCSSCPDPNLRQELFRLIWNTTLDIIEGKYISWIDEAKERIVQRNQARQREDQAIKTQRIECVQKYHRMIEDLGDIGLVDLFLSIRGEDLLPVPGEKYFGFLYHEPTKLWRPIDNIGILAHRIGEILVPIIENYIEGLRTLLQIIPSDKVDARANMIDRISRVSIIKLSMCGLSSQISVAKSLWLKVFDRFEPFELMMKLFSLDMIKHLLPIRDNKVINMKTGECIDRLREHYFTRSCPVRWNPKADPHRWNRFLTGVSLGSKDWEEAYRNVMSYCTTGELGAKKFFIFDGEGNNGKTVALNMHRNFLGDFCTEVKDHVILEGARDNGDNPSPSHAALKNVRTATHGEVDPGKKFCENFILRLVGGDPIDGRYLYKDLLKFISPAKLILAVNNKPNMGINPAMWNRCWRQFWGAKFVTNPDPNSKSNERLIDESFKEEMPNDENDRSAYLNWLIPGWIQYYSTGKLIVPELIQKDIDSYKKSDNHIIDFLEEHCEPYTTGSIETTPIENDSPSIYLYKLYNKWQGVDKKLKVTQKAFGTMINKILGRHSGRKGASQRTYYEGLRIKDEYRGGVWEDGRLFPM